MIPKTTVHRSAIRSIALVFFALLPFSGHRLQAEVAEPGERKPEHFSFLRLWAGEHDFDDERWNLYGQSTYIFTDKHRFRATYTNKNDSPNSLSPDAEHSYTGTLTAFAGARLWHGAEFYLVPEMIVERPLSGLHGLGGSVQNFELQKNGSESPTYYRSRAYLKQTINFGEPTVPLKSGPMQLGQTVSRHRLVITAGNLSVVDVFDKNSFSGDLRQQFLNMSFLTYAAYDFAADARGYSWGGILEYFYDNWALRLGRFVPPKNPNQLPLNNGFLRYHGDQAEIEHSHTLLGRSGAIRILAYRNHEFMARWDDAIRSYENDPAKNATTCTGFHYDSKNASAPDLCWARRPNNKLGAGVNLEQKISDDIGLFFRGMRSDGKTEVYSYTSTDQSISFGALINGSLWHRSDDAFGLGWAEGWISRDHARYLNMGGVDGFIGDGKIKNRPEQTLDLFYRLNIVRSLWTTLDLQHIANPAYNADRGPVNLISFRAHAEF